MGVLLLIGLTHNEVDMVQSDRTVVGQCVLDQGVRVSALVLSQLLVALVEIYTVALDISGNPGLVVSVGLAVREVQLVVQLVVLVLKTQHLQQIYISRSCAHDTVDDRVTCQHIIDEQGVRSRDVTMHGIVVHTVAIGIIAVAAGRSHLVVEHPCALVVSLNRRLHAQGTKQHVGHVAIHTLDIQVTVAVGRHTHTVLA